jgi:cytochrome c peroxidase
VQFGKKLFSDTRFSANGKISCATCHKAEIAF